MRRWVMITTMNKRLNSPIRPCPFPSYTPLNILPNSSILSCDGHNTSSTIDKGFLKDPREDNRPTPCYPSLIANGAVS